MENEKNDFETRKVLDDEKLVDEFQKWNKKAYEMNKLGFLFIVVALAMAPVLIPLWFTVSLAKHFSGKDLWKKQVYKVVGEE